MAKFMRKNPDPTGKYYLAYKVRDDEFGNPKVEEISIEGRNILDTDEKKLIEILKTDPEIVEVNKKTQIEATDEDEK